LVAELGRPPQIGEAPEPAGEALEVIAVSLNPLDRAVAAGRFYDGHPPLPFVPGCECVGREPGGRVVWTFGGGLGLTRDGTLAERAQPGAVMVEVPDGADTALAAALGIAGLAGWLPLAWRAPVRDDDRVLVLGATGAVGQVAVQAAKLLGAAHVVAAGRNPAGLERALALGADEAVGLDGDFGEPSYVFDPLCGEPLERAVAAAAPGARIVQHGQSAGPAATLTSAAIRGKQLELYGFSDFGVAADVLAEHYRRLVGHAVAGEIVLEVERIGLDEVASAWDRPGKLVVAP
jgi:NADPH:quinone reductase-like Zn-dependent oxidoreductase